MKKLERTSRIDAEFFKKSFLRSAALIELWERDSIAALTCVSDGNHFSISDDFVEDGVPYYRGQDVTGRFFIETASPVHITRDAYDRKYMKRSYLKRGDVLLSIVGTIGELSLVASDQPATCSCKLAILRPLDAPPELIAVFLRSEHGQNQIARLTRGAVQKGLILEDMDQLWVPRLPEEFEKRIARIVHAAHKTQEQSESRQKEAEDTLLAALGLTDWTPPEPLSYTARTSDVFAAGRLDAEFFQPRLKSLINRLEEAAGNFRLVKLGDYSEPLKYGNSEKLEYTDKGTPFLRIADLNERRFDLLSVKFIDKKLVFSESETVKVGDILVSRSGTLGLAAPITEEFDDAIFGSYFIRVRPDNSAFNAEFLTLFINSIAGVVQFEAVKTGGIQTNLTISAIENLVIPLGTLEWQATFVNLVSEGLEARDRARQTLETAKHAVEIAIENGEAAAMTFLDQAHGIS